MDQSPRTAALDQFRKGEVTAADRLRRRRARARHSRRQPHLQFRRAAPCRRLRPPHRPHRPRRQDRHRHHHRRAADNKSLAAIEKLIGQTIPWMGEPPRAADERPASEPRRDGHRRHGRPAPPRRHSEPAPVARLDEARPRRPAPKPARASSHRRRGGERSSSGLFAAPVPGQGLIASPPFGHFDCFCPISGAEPFTPHSSACTTLHV